MSEPRSKGGRPRGRAQSIVHATRFDATIHAAKGSGLPARLDELDLDRVPDQGGRIRALLTADDCVRLLDLGFEVRLHRAHPVRPLDPRLIETDESVRRWLDERLEGIERAGPDAASEPEGT